MLGLTWGKLYIEKPLCSTFYELRMIIVTKKIKSYETFINIFFFWLMYSAAG